MYQGEVREGVARTLVGGCFYRNVSLSYRSLGACNGKIFLKPAYFEQ